MRFYGGRFRSTLARVRLLLIAAVWFGFRTPSGNIVCNGGAASVACVVFSASPTCQKTWSLRATGRASFHCLYANIGTDVSTLAYGRSLGRAGIRCVSRRAGLTCKNRALHGFFLSRGLQRTF
jgi:hypothetical protein